METQRAGTDTTPPLMDSSLQKALPELDISSGGFSTIAAVRWQRSANPNGPSIRM